MRKLFSLPTKQYPPLQLFFMHPISPSSFCVGKCTHVPLIEVMCEYVGRFCHPLLFPSLMLAPLVMGVGVAGVATPGVADVEPAATEGALGSVVKHGCWFPTAQSTILYQPIRVEPSPCSIGPKNNFFSSILSANWRHKLPVPENSPSESSAHRHPLRRRGGALE